MDEQGFTKPAFVFSHYDSGAVERNRRLSVLDRFCNHFVKFCAFPENNASFPGETPA